MAEDAITGLLADPIQVCTDVILKEAREEIRLVKQLIGVMLRVTTIQRMNSCGILSVVP